MGEARCLQMYSWVDEGVRVVDGRSELKASAVRRTRCANRRHWAGYGFWVPPEKLARLIDPPVGFRGRPRMWDVTQPTTLFSGGGGLVSTAADYLRFCQMLLNGGELDGVRIVKAATVRQMTTDALPPEIRFAEVDGVAMGPQTGATWGLGFALRNSAAGSQVPGSLGSFTRSGIWGTYFWVDPAEQLIALQLIQVAPGRGGPFIRRVSQSHLWRVHHSRPWGSGIDRDAGGDRRGGARKLHRHLRVLLDMHT
jgi:CubicO group peptidase (beta-lactamase class C family)